MQDKTKRRTKVVVVTHPSLGVLGLCETLNMCFVSADVQVFVREDSGSLRQYGFDDGEHLGMHDVQDANCCRSVDCNKE